MLRGVLGRVVVPVVDDVEVGQEGVAFITLLVVVDDALEDIYTLLVNPTARQYCTNRERSLPVTIFLPAGSKYLANIPSHMSWLLSLPLTMTVAM